MVQLLILSLSPSAKMQQFTPLTYPKTGYTEIGFCHRKTQNGAPVGILQALCPMNEDGLMWFEMIWYDLIWFDVIWYNSKCFVSEIQQIKFSKIQKFKIAGLSPAKAGKSHGKLFTLFCMPCKASRGFEPRSLDSESRVLTVTPRGQCNAWFALVMTQWKMSKKPVLRK